MKKQIVFTNFAICFSIFVIWRRQLLPGDNSDKEQDGATLCVPNSLHGNAKNVAGKILESDPNFDKIHRTNLSTVKLLSKHLTHLKLSHDNNLLNDRSDESNLIKEENTPYPPENVLLEKNRTETEIADDAADDDDDKTVDERMEGFLFLGSINASRKYAVFSATTEGLSSLSYIFYLPLTALAWKRIGFDSIVIIVGSKTEWDLDPLLYHVLSTVKSLDSVVVFLDPLSEISLMISQVARIYVANMLHAAFPDIDNVYIITSDADLWPINGTIYELPRDKQILSLNSDCCSPFKHRNTTYKMLPMANVGMTIRTWRKLTRKFDESPRSVNAIITVFVQEFGTVAQEPVHKGENMGWYLDQMMTSILIAKWIKERGAETVKFVPRNVGIDRIDRSRWSRPNGQNDLDGKVDAHLLLEAYSPGVWARMTHLIRLMYGDKTPQYLWCIKYYEEFQKQFLAEYPVKQS